MERLLFPEVLVGGFLLTAADSQREGAAPPFQQLTCHRTVKLDTSSNMAAFMGPLGGALGAQEPFCGICPLGKPASLQEELGLWERIWSSGAEL